VARRGGPAGAHPLRVGALRFPSWQRLTLNTGSRAAGRPPTRGPANWQARPVCAVSWHLLLWVTDTALPRLGAGPV